MSESQSKLLLVLSGAHFLVVSVFKQTAERNCIFSLRNGEASVHVLGIFLFVHSLTSKCLIMRLEDGQLATRLLHFFIQLSHVPFESLFAHLVVFLNVGR